jgi:4'-phosphopantetheinyl transferase
MQPLLPKPVFQDRIEGVWIGLFNLDDLSQDSLIDIQLTHPENNEALLLKTPQQQERFIKRKKLLKLLLADYAGVHPNTLLIEKTPHGKPYLAKPERTLQFSTSHSYNMFLVGIGPQSLGVDIEKQDASIDYTAIAQQFFTENECQLIKTSVDPVASFYILWTQKEALLKLVGEPLSKGFIENQMATCFHIPIPSHHLSLPYVAALALS